jgi:hypothetical protein
MNSRNGIGINKELPEMVTQAPQLNYYINASWVLTLNGDRESGYA